MREAYRKQRYFTASHHHFAEIRETVAGNPYVVFDQCTMREGKWHSQKILIFENEINELISFLEGFRDAMKNKQYKKVPNSSISQIKEMEAQYMEETQSDVEMEELLRDLEDDLDDYNASEEDGWFYRD